MGMASAATAASWNTLNRTSRRNGTMPAPRYSTCLVGSGGSPASRDMSPFDVQGPPIKLESLHRTNGKQVPSGRTERESWRGREIDFTNSCTQSADISDASSRRTSTTAGPGAACTPLRCLVPAATSSAGSRSFIRRDGLAHCRVAARGCAVGRCPELAIRCGVFSRARTSCCCCRQPAMRDIAGGWWLPRGLTDAARCDCCCRIWKAWQIPGVMPAQPWCRMTGRLLQRRSALRALCGCRWAPSPQSRVLTNSRPLCFGACCQANVRVACAGRWMKTGSWRIDAASMQQARLRGGSTPRGLMSWYVRKLRSIDGL